MNLMHLNIQQTTKIYCLSPLIVRLFCLADPFYISFLYKIRSGFDFSSFIKARPSYLYFFLCTTDGQQVSSKILLWERGISEQSK